MLWVSLLTLLLLNPIGFLLLCFHYYLFPCIYWFPLWFIQGSVAYLGVCCLAFVYLWFLVFFPCSLDLILQYCDKKNCWKKLQFLKIYQDLTCGPGCYLSWRTFHIHLRKSWNPLFLGEMSYRYQLSPTTPMYHLKLLFPC